MFLETAVHCGSQMDLPMCWNQQLIFSCRAAASQKHFVLSMTSFKEGKMWRVRLQMCKDTSSNQMLLSSHLLVFISCGSVDFNYDLCFSLLLTISQCFRINAVAAQRHFPHSFFVFFCSACLFCSWFKYWLELHEINSFVCSAFFYAYFHLRTVGKVGFVICSHWRTPFLAYLQQLQSE